MGAAKAVITHLPWRIVYGGYLFQEQVYRRVFGLRAMGELIYLGRASYRGPSKILSDDTRINAGDPRRQLIHRHASGAIFEAHDEANAH
jgi:hypothetical protein